MCAVAGNRTESREWESLHFISAKEENRKVNSSLDSEQILFLLKEGPLTPSNDENVVKTLFR